MVTGRFTYIGLTIVGLGWVVLAADMALSQAFLTPGNMVAVLSMRGDIVTIAQTAILSGFALALLGALREGFGALNRFFEAVLQRSSAPRPAPAVEPMPEPAPPAPMPTPAVSIEPLRRRAASRTATT